MNKPRAFISCKSTEYSLRLSRSLKKFLEKNGWWVYFAVDSPEYKILANKIRREVRGSDFLIAIIEKGEQSPSVHQEITYAEGRTESILMVDRRNENDLGVLIEGREFELFDEDNFQYSINRVYMYMKKTLLEKTLLETGTSPHMRTLQEPLMIQNSYISEPTVTPQVRQSSNRARSSRFAYEESAISNKAPPIWYRKYSDCIKMITNDISCTLKYGGTWGVCQASLPIRNGAIWITAIMDTETRFILDHILTMTKPNADTISIILQTAQIVAKTPKTIRTNFHSPYSKAIKKTFESTKHENKSGQTMHKYHKGSLSGLEKYLESALEKISKHTSEHNLEEFQRMAQYEIINYNYIQSRETLGTVPSTAAKFPLPFDSFDDIRHRSFTYEKAFINKLGNRIRLVRIHVGAKNKRITIKLKPDLKKLDREKIALILRECGFQLRNKRWTRKSSFLDMLYTVNSRGRGLPARTFEICDICGNIARSLQEVFVMNGFRNDGIVRTQPRCRNCRCGSKTLKIRFRPRLDQTLGRPKVTMDNFLKYGTSDKATKCVVTEPHEDHNWLQESGHQMTL